MSQTCVFSTYGARGDVFPYLAIARQWQRSGGRAIVATSSNYRAEIEALGLEFRALAPDGPTPAQAQKMMHRVTGTESLFCDLLLPPLQQSVAQLREVCRGADILVTHTTSLAGPIVAELENSRGLRWASCAVSPLALLQPDAALPALPRAADFPLINGAILWLLRRQLGMKLKITQKIRADLGVSRGDNALWSDGHSPQLQLALWPSFFAPIPPESSRQAIGFCFLEAQTAHAPEIDDFLRSGEAPLVFVAASFAAGEKWEAESLAAAQKMGKRAILLGARENSRADFYLKCCFAALETILPRALALIHAGGIGTLAQGLRAGTPMLLQPHAHDQFDNARRAARLGLARVKRKDLAPEIGALLGDRGLKNRLADVCPATENGAACAVEVLKNFAVD